jgi:GxxExxY protein
MLKEEILYKNLSYKIQGILMEARKMYGPGFKEIVYCNAVEELLQRGKIKYKREQNINIHSPISSKIIGNYRPDFIIDDKIILEVKAVDIIPKNFIDQIYSYLKVSNFELAIFVNFKSPKLYIKRIIYTNDRKFKRKQ